MYAGMGAGMHAAMHAAMHVSCDVCFRASMYVTMPPTAIEIECAIGAVGWGQLTPIGFTLNTGMPRACT